MTVQTSAVPAASGRSEAIQAFLAAAGWGDASLLPLKGDASFRRYIRVQRRNESAMLMDAPPEKEDIVPYAQIARYLEHLGYSAPRIFAEDTAQGFLLSEDLGDTLFTALLKEDANAAASLYDAAVDLLVSWQKEPRMHRETETLPLPEYDLPELLREVSLFCDWYMPEALGKEEAAALRGEYLELWERLLKEADLTCEQFVHRDYHADNLMWLTDRDGAKRVGLLDFQDALWGHPAYDLMSLLEDARRDVAPALQLHCFDRYLQGTGLPREAFIADYALLAAQRNCKIVGIFVRLARRDGKHAYLQFLPRVWRYLEHDLSHPRLAPMKAWMDRHIPAEFRGAITVHG